MSVRQSVLQSIYRFNLIPLSSVNTDYEIEISSINLIVVIHIDSPYGRFCKSILSFIVSFHPNQVILGVNSFQSFIRTNPNITFLILFHGKYALYSDGKIYLFICPCFRVKPHQSFRSTYPQAVSRILAETLNSRVYILSVTRLQMKILHLLRHRMNKNNFSLPASQPNLSPLAFKDCIASGIFGYLLPRFKSRMHRKHRFGTLHYTTVGHRHPNISPGILNHPAYSGFKHLLHPAIYTIANIKFCNSTAKSTCP